MKTFAIYTIVNIKRKPKWLDAFRAKYDDPYEFHVTLKQPSFIENESLSELKDKVIKFFKEKQIKKIKVNFSKVILDEPASDSEGTIMIGATEKKALSKLQKDLVSYLKNYNAYCDPQSKAWEENFVPHITIGRDLQKQRFNQAVSELPEKVIVQTVIDEIVLAIVPNDNPEERINPKNLTVFYLA